MAKSKKPPHEKWMDDMTVLYGVLRDVGMSHEEAAQKLHQGVDMLMQEIGDAYKQAGTSADGRGQEANQPAPG